MALSEYEQRVLTEIEKHLVEVPRGRIWRLRAFALRYAPAIGASAAALSLIILLALFGSGTELAAPIAGAAAGYLICAGRPGPKRGRNK